MVSPTPDNFKNFRVSTLGLLTQEEVASILGVAASSVEIWRGEGKGPCFVKLGKNVFYRVEDIREWAAAQVQHKPARLNVPAEVTA